MVLAVGTALLCGLPLAYGQDPAPAPAPRKPAVLFQIRKVDPTFRAQLEKAGFVVHEQRAQNVDLTWDLLKQFNVLVLSEWCKRDRRMDLTKRPESAEKTAVPAMRQFLENGGGILANCAGAFAGTVSSEAAMQTSLMQEWGAKLTPQRVTDATTEQAAGGYRLSYLYTDQIAAAAPVADGVRGLWLGWGHWGQTYFF